MNQERKRSKMKSGGVKLPKDQGTRVTDHTISSEDIIRYSPEIRETYGEAVKRCGELKAAYDPLLRAHGLRLLRIDEFLIALQNRRIPDAKLRASLAGTILDPLAEIYAKLAELDSQLEDLRKNEASGIYRAALSQSEKSQIEGLFTVFLGGLDELRLLYSECAGTRDLIKESQVNAEHAVYTAERFAISLREQAVKLSELLALKNREFGAATLNDAGSLMAAAEEIEEHLKVFRGKLGGYEREKKIHAGALEAFSTARSWITESERRERLTLQKIRAREEFFREAEIDPYAALGEEHRITFAETPLEECRKLLTKEPALFPAFDERGLIKRAEDLIGRLLKEAAHLEEKERAAIPPPPLRRLVQEEKPAETAGPLSPLQLAVSTYAAFCHPNYPTSGRTIRKVWEEVLVKEGFCFGFSEDAFIRAVATAEEQQLLSRFTMGRKKRVYICFRPTPHGFTAAEAWFKFLPPDFRTKVLAAIQSLKAAQLERRREIVAKRKQRS